MDLGPSRARPVARASGDPRDWLRLVASATPMARMVAALASVMSSPGMVVASWTRWAPFHQVPAAAGTFGP